MVEEIKDSRTAVRLLVTTLLDSFLMKLLHWCTLQPKSSSGLAAIRFTAPVRVSKIRVFPNGARPFVQCPDIVAYAAYFHSLTSLSSLYSRTHPDSFFLDVFFNAMPINPAESKDKQRAPNALVPTTIAYAGGQVDFTVDLGTEVGSGFSSFPCLTLVSSSMPRVS